MFPAHSVMTKEVITVKANTPIMDAVSLLIKNSISGLPVVDDDNNLIGIFSEKDALSLLHNTSDTLLNVADFMTDQVISFDENESLIKLCQCLIDNPFRRVPITSGKKLVGIVSRRDIMKKILEIRNYKLDKQNLAGEDA